VVVCLDVLDLLSPLLALNLHFDARGASELTTVVVPRLWDDGVSLVTTYTRERGLLGGHAGGVVGVESDGVSLVVRSKE